MTATNKCYNFVGFRYSPPLEENEKSQLFFPSYLTPPPPQAKVKR